MEGVVGRRPVLEAVRAGVAREVLVAEGARSTAGLRDLLDEARSAGIPVRRVSPDRVAQVAGGARHQGVAATVKAPRRLTEADLSRHRWEEDAVVLVLDGVTDPHNVGAVGRTAEAAGAAALILRRKREAGLTPTALRASAGALLHLPVAEVPNVVRALERLRDRGFWIVGLDVGGQASLFDARPPPGPLALVVGSEGSGLSRLVRESCDELVAIPLRGRVASLNVSVATGVALFAYTGRQVGPPEQES
jgi:23S rRNA (guanosine2251-2'-O)-methyltransferase